MRLRDEAERWTTEPRRNLKPSSLSILGMIENARINFNLPITAYLIAKRLQRLEEDVLDDLVSLVSDGWIEPFGETRESLQLTSKALRWIGMG
jgi:hypothetical protein